MGCDIHFFVEVFKEGTWRLAEGQVEVCTRCKGSGLDPEEGHCGNCKGPLREHMPEGGKCLYDTTTLSRIPDRCTEYCAAGKIFQTPYYTGRNYDLFSLLSGVRGPPDPEFTIEDRGIPEDCDPVIAAYMDNDDLHSFGYYTLAELQAFPFKARLFRDFVKTLEKMSRLTDNPENVRAVFCYDN